MFKANALLLATSALTACATATVTDEDTSVSEVLTGAQALNIGTKSTTQSANGLAFANADTELADAQGQEVTVRLVRFFSDKQSGETFLQVTRETGAITPSDETPTFDGTITFAGETLTFVDGLAKLANGQIIEMYDNTSADYSGTVGIYSYADEGDDTGINTEGFFAIGFETNPSVVADSLGSVLYSGDIYGYGTMLAQDGRILSNEVEMTGMVFVEVDFDDSGVYGGLQLEYDGDFGANIFIDETDLIGNGFSTTMTDIESCRDGFACVSDSTIGGALFGPNAEEASGVFGIDLTLTEDGTGDVTQLIGAGGYTGTQVRPEPE